MNEVQQPSNEILIGSVNIKFDESGKITYSEFVPLLKTIADKELIEKFNSISVAPDEDVIRSMGEALLSRFFSHLTRIELSDQEKYGIKSRTLTCDKYANGMVKACVVSYSFGLLA